MYKKKSRNYQSGFSLSASGTLVSLSMECVVFKSLVMACVLCAAAFSELLGSARRSDGWRVTTAWDGRSKKKKKKQIRK